MAGLNVRFLSGLNDVQRAAVLHEQGPCAVFAGPGSGKTRVVTLRAARLATEGSPLLVTTFTTEAAHEMESRLTAMLAATEMNFVTVSTLHAFCLKVLKSELPAFKLLTDPHQQRSLADLAGARDLDGGSRAFLTQVSLTKNMGSTSKTYKPDDSGGDREFARTWRAYEKAKIERGLYDFDDLILSVRDLFATNDAVRSKYAAEFQFIIVDECQDMNGPQFAITLSLGRDHRNVMLVGDLDQSLYAFRGADATTFRAFAEHASTRVFELSHNYRSTQAIMQFADALIRQDANRHPLPFQPTRDEGLPVRWMRLSDADDEAEETAQEILDLHRAGLPYNDVAVLVRVNAQSEAFERIFAAHEIPFASRQDGDFYARKEVQGLITYLQYLAPDEQTNKAFADEWLLALLNIPDRKIHRDVGQQLIHVAQMRNRPVREILAEFPAPDLRSFKGIKLLADQLAQLEEQLPHCENAGQLIAKIRSVTGYDRWITTDPRGVREQEDDDRLLNLARVEEAATHYPDAAAYLKAVRMVRDAKQKRRKDRRGHKQLDEITLVTGHGAKGLEWKVVFAVGWSEFILPHRKATNYDEERRIAYVIATRARDRLYVSSIDRWNDSITAPSRFLTSLNLSAASPPVREPAEANSEDTNSLLGGLFE